jgi:hypothetical protein
MGGPAIDPFADLFSDLNVCSADYVHCLTTDEATFESDCAMNGRATRRGFLRNSDPNQPIGQRPSCWLQDKEAAGLTASNDHAL